MAAQAALVVQRLYNKGWAPCQRGMKGICSRIEQKSLVPHFKEIGSSVSYEPLNMVVFFSSMPWATVSSWSDLAIVSAGVGRRVSSFYTDMP